jgi:hypothetical protein
LRLQSTGFRYRVSYDMDPDRFDASALDIVAEMGLDALVSDNRYFDVLPKDVSKGPSLLRLLTHLGVANERCLVAGDTLNDLSMLSLGLPAVAVGNSEPALGRRWRGRITCISPPATVPRALPRPFSPSTSCVATRPEKGELPCHRISSSSTTANPTKRSRKTARSC